MEAALKKLLRLGVTTTRLKLARLAPVLARLFLFGRSALLRIASGLPKHLPNRELRFSARGGPWGWLAVGPR